MQNQNREKATNFGKFHAEGLTKAGVGGAGTFAGKQRKHSNLARSRSRTSLKPVAVVKYGICGSVGIGSTKVAEGGIAILIVIV